MKTTLKNGIGGLAFASALILTLPPSTASAQGTAFTYQARLDSAGAPANGIFDFRFSIFDAAAGGALVAGPLTNAATAVSNGLFSVTLDFGAGVFSGPARWLEIALRPSGGGDFTSLSPRQPITPAPYAITAGNFAGVVAPAALSNAWKVTGNAGTTPGTHFLGTTDNQPVEIKANGERVLRLEPDGGGSSAGNLIAGYTNNTVHPSSGGNTIAGGGWVGGINAIRENARGNFIGAGSGNLIGAGVNDAMIGAGYGNLVAAFRSVIGGGFNNTNAEYESVIGGGRNNVIQPQADHAFIGGGQNNRIGGSSGPALGAIAGGYNNLIQTNVAYGFIGGGSNNVVLAGSPAASIGGGAANTVQGTYATVPGGDRNFATTNSFAAGHRARANHTGTFVWADDTDADFNSTTNKQFAVRANHGVMIQATNTALDLRGGGALRVAGAGVGAATPAFIHRVTLANVSGHVTYIDHPHCNGDPGAILLVTHNWSADTATNPFETQPVGVGYDGTRWAIFHENASVPMPVGRAFNVLVIKP